MWIAIRTCWGVAKSKCALANMYKALFLDAFRSLPPAIEEKEAALLRAAVAMACVSTGSIVGSMTQAGQKGNDE